MPTVETGHFAGEPLMEWLLALGLGAIAAGWGLIEYQYRQREGNDLELDEGKWERLIFEKQRYVLLGSFVATNFTEGWDVFIPEVKPEVTLLAEGSTATLQQRIGLRALHPGQKPRDDNYWEAYIVKGKHATQLEIEVELTGPDLSILEALWVRVHYLTYGPEGRIPRVRHCVVPLRFPDPNGPERWLPTPTADVLPIRTHLLSPLDDVVEVLRHYVMPHAQTGDVVTIGESPLAIMQGRWRHPSDIYPGWLARRLCYYFIRTSSLATACGLQALIDEVGAWRVALAFAVGAIAKGLFRIPGVFYRLAGEQARLIDDVTGTIPPYDQFIVYGPENPQAVCDRILAETGLQAAIVDVNDLKRVFVLAKTPGVTLELLNEALLDNPAGNAAEQTPVVLIRPTNGV
ncbi:MAG: F420-0:Gamma-glutamyl ligase [Oscillatoriales cyanobacterium SM2_1_8]|nr:F420-0:Gamma-glutamyl ligase [Oscillatoriales cyanobacterium SM2_1_8]